MKKVKSKFVMMALLGFAGALALRRRKAKAMNW